MKFSGSSGIRMKWSRELVDIVGSMGLRIGNMYDDVALAGDFRETTPAILSIIAGSLMSGGADVYFGGHLPTPTLAYGTKEHEVGVMITASHNPAEYNGIKLWNPDGSAFSDAQMEGLERGGKIGEWCRVGKMHGEDMLSVHMDSILRSAEQLNLKIVIDCSNGAGSVITPVLLRKLGARVIGINCNVDGTFPGHSGEPREENLEILKRMVIRTHSDLGIAHDGDADRFIAVTASGRYLNGDYILAIFTKMYGFARIVAPVDSSMLLENFAEVIRTRVGDANVSQKMKELDVKFGGESSGTQIFASWRYTPDAIYAAVKFAEIAQREDIDSIVEDFPRYHTFRESIVYENRGRAEKVVGNIVKDYDARTVDGYRVTLSDAWFLIRFSGTEPKIRITVESENEEEGRKIMDDILRRIREGLK